MEKPKIIRWGIIGLGKIAHKFAQDLALVPDVTLAAVAASDINRAKIFATQHNVSQFFGCYEDILTADVDIIYIATPHNMHYNCTMMCLAKGIAVLCEKPMGIKASQVLEMTMLAQEKRVFLMEAMWTRFIPSFRRALEIVQSGKYGAPISLHADFGFNADFDPNSRVFNKQLAGGSLLDVGIYPAMIAQCIFGNPLTIQALGKMTATNVDESCAAIMQYPKGEIAMLHSSIVTRTMTEATIYCERGAVFLPSRFHHAKAVSEYIYGETATVTHLPFEGHGYHFEAQAVSDCLRRGETQCADWTYQNSLDLIYTLDRIRAEIGLEY